MANFKGDVVVEKNLRSHSLTTDADVQSTSSGTKLLDNFSASSHIFIGTVSGQAVNFGDCTLYEIGQQYTIDNRSSQNITIKNFSGSDIFTVGSSQRIVAICQDNTSQDGEWSISISKIGNAMLDHIAFTYLHMGA